MKSVSLLLIVLLGVLMFASSRDASKRNGSLGQEVESKPTPNPYVELLEREAAQAKIDPRPNLSYPPYQERSPNLHFRGHACTIDCSGHEAGYQWAEDNGIEDPDDCDGNSNSFIEGCRAFAEEQTEGK